MADPDPGPVFGRTDGPLAGERVVICRAVADAQPLVAQLEALGATVVSIPLVEPIPPADGGEALRVAVGKLSEYSWLVTTSANGSRAVLKAFSEAASSERTGGEGVGLEVAESVDGRRGWSTRLNVACVGSATARVFTEAGVAVRLRASVSSAAGLVEQFPTCEPSEGNRPRILAPLAVLASDVVEEGLTKKGYLVDRVDAYSTRPQKVTSRQRSEIAAATSVLFTSSSTVTRLVDAVGLESTPPVNICIGPQTEQTVRAAGLVPTAVASQHTQQGTVEALVDVVTSMKS